MPAKLIRACTAIVMTLLALFSAHTASALWQPSLHFGSASADHPSVAPATAQSCANPYTVRKGDTLAAIARRCGVSVATLQRLNGLRSDTLLAGQALYVRSTTRLSTTKVPAPVPTPRIDSPPSPW
jgi:LysM repeat protein